MDKPYQQFGFACGHIYFGFAIWTFTLSTAIANYLDNIVDYSLTCVDRFEKFVLDGKYVDTFVTVYFTHAKKTFDLKSEFIVRLLYDTRIRCARLKFRLRDAQIETDWFGNKYYKISFLLRLLKPLPLITRVRATHQCVNHKIYLQGIEILDSYSNVRIFNPIREWIIGGVDIDTARRLYIKPQTLRFCSNHTFCLTFDKILVKDFGQELRPIDDKQSGKSMSKIYGVLIPAKMTSNEKTVFSALLLSLTFVINILILVIDFENVSKGERLRIYLSIGFSGLISLLISEGLAYVFVRWIRANYEYTESEKALSDLDISLWPIYKCAYLVLISFLAFVATSLAMAIPYAVENNESIVRRYNWETFGNASQENDTVHFGFTQHWRQRTPLGIYHSIDEIIFLFPIYLTSIGLVFTFWRFIFCSLRFLYRMITFKPKPFKMDPKDDNSPDIFEDEIPLSPVIIKPVPQKQVV